MEKIKARMEDERKKLKELERKEKQAERKRDTRAKIVIGGLMVGKAQEKPETRKNLIRMLEQEVTRKQDKEAVQPLIDELKALGSAAGASDEGKAEQKGA
jgi:hypothetical protein